MQTRPLFLMLHFIATHWQHVLILIDNPVKVFIVMMMINSPVIIIVSVETSKLKKKGDQAAACSFCPSSCGSLELITDNTINHVCDASAVVVILPLLQVRPVGANLLLPWNSSVFCFVFFHHCSVAMGVTFR